MKQKSRSKKRYYKNHRSLRRSQQSLSRSLQRSPRQRLSPRRANRQSPTRYNSYITEISSPQESYTTNTPGVAVSAAITALATFMYMENRFLQKSAQQLKEQLIQKGNANTIEPSTYKDMVIQSMPTFYRVAKTVPFIVLQMYYPFAAVLLKPLLQGVDEPGINVNEKIKEVDLFQESLENKRYWFNPMNMFSATK